MSQRWDGSYMLHGWNKLQHVSVLSVLYYRHPMRLEREIRFTLSLLITDLWHHYSMARTDSAGTRCRTSIKRQTK